MQIKGHPIASLTDSIGFPVKGLGITAAVLALSAVIYLCFPQPPALNIKAFPAGGGKYYESRQWEEEAEANHTDNGSNRSGEPGNLPAGGMAVPGKLEASPVETTYGGFKEEFDISEGARCTSKSEVVMTVQSNRPLYARGRVFDTFDGAVWKHAWVYKPKLLAHRGQFLFDKTFSGEGFGQIYTIRRDLPAVIFAGYRPVSLYLRASVIEAGHDHAIGLSSFLARGTVYTVLSDTRLLNGNPSRSYGGPEDYVEKAIYLQVPDKLSPEVGKLANNVVRGVSGDYERAAALEAHLKAAYIYTTDTIGVRFKEGEVERFLFESRKGHCEHFATSMVMMLRSVGIPARLVTGFVVKRFNPFTGYYDVMSDDAHAWAEAYLQGIGWVSFEPTPGFIFPQKTRSIIAGTEVRRFLTEKVRRYVSERRDGYTARFLDKVLRMWDGTVQFMWRVFQNIKGVFIAFWWLLLAGGWMVLLGIAAVVATGYLLVVKTRPYFARRKLLWIRDKEPEAFILRCYQEAGVALGRWGISLRPEQTPEEYRLSVAAVFALISESIGTLTELLHKALYSGQPVTGQDTEEAYRMLMEISSFDPHKKR